MNCDSVINDYLSWLKGNFEVHRFGSDCIITTPFLDPGGDHIEIKVITDNDKVFVTDDGMTHDFLFMSGIDMFGKSNTRKINLDIALNKNSSFIYNNNEIATYINPNEDIGSAINRLIRAITSIQHLVYTIKEVPFRTFKDDVADFFIKNQVGYKSDHLILGKTKEHKLDFFIQKESRDIAFKALSTESGPYAKKLAIETAFVFFDIKDRNPNLYSVSIIDDTKNVWPPDTTIILSNYTDRLLKWSKQDEILELVA